MRCLLVADLHYDLRKFDWVVAAAAQVDVVVLAGDHLDAAAVVGRPSQALIVQKYFRRIRERAPLLVCSGNHDLDHRDSRGVMSTLWIARARHLDVPTDGDSLVIGDTLFTICPWSDGQGKRTQIASLLERDAARAAGALGLGASRAARRIADQLGRPQMLRRPGRAGWIERLQPDLVLSGHVHQSPFTKDGSWADRIGATWVFNAGHQIGPAPSHIVVDTARPGAFWCSLAAIEQTPLTATASRPYPPVVDPPAWLLAMARPAAPTPG